MKQPDKIVLFFPDVVFILHGQRAALLLTETCVHCKWLISVQHRWGQLIFSAISLGCQRKKKIKKIPVYFPQLEHSVSFICQRVGYIRRAATLAALQTARRLICCKVCSPCHVFGKIYSSERYIHTHLTV